MTRPRLTATVSGSFHRHLESIERAVRALGQLGVYVASPSDPRVVDNVGEFLFVASDRNRSVRMVQDRHLESIAASAFVWLASPDGYVGQSASLEIGFAVAAGIPIYAESLPGDLTLREYVTRTTIDAVVSYHMANRRQTQPPAFLIDPKASLETAHDALERISRSLARPAHLIQAPEAQAIRHDRLIVANVFDSMGPSQSARKKRSNGIR